uniref:Uncharacterized protein n=1 Tax=Oryza glaberrima TaxID=4538 RepID=I1QQG1_ORYGL
MPTPVVAAKPCLLPTAVPALDVAIVSSRHCRLQPPSSPPPAAAPMPRPPHLLPPRPARTFPPLDALARTRAHPVRFRNRGIMLTIIHPAPPMPLLGRLPTCTRPLPLFL